ncbi:MAG: hypothetical protein A3H32_15880 [Betaproteobacteria bacterium RIFCSPLOWO2_02_FULL_63_19]|nr:MAG: hypothetical protein A3H32_15880 [Betaproteobacteria bacterium RIFCSPLOWO2_02_FULL_63_19]
MAFIACVGMIGAGLTFSAGEVSAQAFIRMGSHAPANIRSVLEYKKWMRQVEKDSGGTLVFKEFWGGQLIRSPRKQFEGMMNGIQDASPILPSYTAKLFPDFSLFALPFLFRDAEEASYVGWKMYDAGLLRGLDKVYVATVYTNDNGGMHFREKLASVEAMRGLKVRAAGPGESAMIKAMGGIPVGMSITQIAQSLSSGVIQGTLAGWQALDAFKIMPLVRTHIDYPFGVRGFFIGITKKVYDVLPAKAKQALNKNSGLSLSRRLGRLNQEEGDQLRRRAREDPNRVVFTLTDEQIAVQAKKFHPFHDEWIAKTKDGAKKYQALRRFIAEYRKGI